MLNSNPKDTIEISLPMRDQIADILRRQIISGELKEGDRISERDISNRFNVSTAPVKEAIRTLVTEGLLYTYPRKGTYVSDFLGENIVQIIHTRSAIEGVAAFWGTKYITDDGIKKMQEYLDNANYLLHHSDLSDDAVLDQIAKMNYHFHLTLSNSCQNEYLIQLVNVMGSINNTIRYMYYVPEKASDFEASYLEHKSILDAVKSHDCELAETLTINHIRRVGDTVLNAQENLINDPAHK